MGTQTITKTMPTEVVNCRWCVSSLTCRKRMDINAEIETTGDSTGDAMSLLIKDNKTAKTCGEFVKRDWKKGKDLL